MNLYLIQITIDPNYYPNSQDTLVEKVLKNLKALRIKEKKKTFEDIAISGTNDRYITE